MPLNINPQQILLHLLNFTILFGVLYFLLYSPVKNFMAKREAYYKDMDDAANEKLASAEEARVSYEQKLNSVDEEIDQKRAAANAELNRNLDAKRQRAQEEAEKMISDARGEAEREREKILSSAQAEISELVSEATEKLVLQASASEAFDQFLGEVERGGAE